ncbi:zinc finger protein with KRAB and SCAN domains 7-like isoform X2 [Sceloporus undulatus]|uniref:zinc finger protein with KRAB and SCAN domains 7-like isoform X2 n=1 Tax=Sceloporus undulatus TaxID=8520 RepID=UPI001C4B7EB5|nr:zinc finger protein with KRAB and SCAN domains 7-like isoform X2 [Sceloporus undulatus]
MQAKEEICRLPFFSQVPIPAGRPSFAPSSLQPPEREQREKKQEQASDKAMKEDISAGTELEEELTVRLRKANGRVQSEYKTEQTGWGRSQEGQGEPSKEMQQHWETQWQEFLKTLHPSCKRWATPVMLEMAPWEDTKFFLASFEQVAKACRWPREEWVARLLPALSGEAEEAFRTLETGDQEDYEKVKATILRGDALRMELQRQHFRQFCCQEVQDPRRIHSQVQELCHRWLKPDRRSKEQILELLVLEQFLASLPPDLQNWIRAVGPDTCSQAVALMEDFLLSQKDAERGKWKFQRPTKEECLSSLGAEGEPLAMAKDEIYEEAQQNTEAEISPMGIGIQGPSCHSSLLPSEEQEMDHTAVKEEPMDLKEPNLPLQIVKQSLSQPGQQTIMWQVLQENGGGVSYLGDGKGRQVKMENSQCGEDEPMQNLKTTPQMGQGKVVETVEMCKEQCKSKTKHRKQSVELEEECTQLARDPIVAIHHPPEVPTRGKMTMSSQYGQTYNYNADIGIIPNREDHEEYSISEENIHQNLFSDNHQQKSTEKFKYELSEDMNGEVLSRDWHEQTEENLSIYSECGNSVSCTKSLKRNQVIHNEGKPYECSHCKKCFSEREEWMKHQQLHTGNKRQECSEAEKVFTFREASMKHQEMRTLMKPYMCSQCGKSFNQRRNLENHQRTHTGVKPYKCSQCGKCFNQTRYLKIHQRIHTGEKPYKCSECGKRFIRGQCLKNHQRTHTGDKPYACSQCGKCFNQRRYLKNHLRIHSGLKPYKCSQCGKSFSQSGALMSHQRIHKEKSHAHVESVRNASNWEEM